MNAFFSELVALAKRHKMWLIGLQLLLLALVAVVLWLSLSMDRRAARYSTLF